MSTGEAVRSSLEPTTQVPEVPKEIADLDRTKRISYKIMNSEIVPFTLDLASRFIEMETFVGERSLDDSHVSNMVRDAKEGNFLTSEAGLASCICQWDGKERRLNGQHTSWMRTYMPASWNPNIRVTKYSVQTEDDFRELYCTFDNIKCDRPHKRS